MAKRKFLAIENGSFSWLIASSLDEAEEMAEDRMCGNVVVLMPKEVKKLKEMLNKKEDW